MTTSTRHRDRDRDRDRGQSAIVVVIVVTMLFVAGAAGLVLMGTRSIDRARAQSAADAAALAALDGGVDVANEFAVRHGAGLVSFVEGPGPLEVTVVVRYGAATATARASAAP